MPSPNSDVEFQIQREVDGEMQSTESRLPHNIEGDATVVEL
jgi:hypothetical protein